MFVKYYTLFVIVLAHLGKFSVHNIGAGLSVSSSSYNYVADAVADVHKLSTAWCFGAQLVVYIAAKVAFSS